MNYFRASALEFRIRYLTHALIFGLGFWSPWDRLLPHGNVLILNASAWPALASLPWKAGWLTFPVATEVVLAIGITAAFLGAFLRTWASAYLGSDIVKDGSMHAGIVAAGPFRRTRNPLYLGTFLHALGLALLMPPTGAIFAEQGVKVSPMWLTVVYLLHTCGELALSPVGLSAMSKLAPVRIGGLIMGVWFLGSSVGNYIGGRLAGFYESMTLPSLFGVVAAFGIGAGLLLLFLSPSLGKLERGQ